MNLPFVLDVAIGLIFIYLIMSLLASEIQELISTLLLWRAAHLKKSIETLLTGGEGTKNEQRVKAIVEELYDNPLIKNISHESKEGIESQLRKLIRAVITLDRREITLTKGNEPSYISSATFATTLIERLNLAHFYQKLSSLQLQKFVEYETNSKIKDLIESNNLTVSDQTRAALEADFSNLKYELQETCKNFHDGKVSLSTSAERLQDEFMFYVNEAKNYTQDDPSVQKLVFQLASLKKSIFYQNNSNAKDIDELLHRLQPRLVYVLDILVNDEKEKSITYAAFEEELQEVKPSSECYAIYQEVKAEIEAISKRLPLSVRKSLLTIAKQAQIDLRRIRTTAQTIEDEVSQFKSEVQVWFDHSMERASGVYKRNAKGVAFLIGCLLAAIANADTLHMVNRLTTDSAMRDALVSNTQSIATNCPPKTSGETVSPLECVRTTVNQTIPLPIGRSETNLKQQAEESAGWFYPPLRRVIGWLVSGLAISMGASFWFDLLSKVVNVRNTGKPPEKSTGR